MVKDVGFCVIIDIDEFVFNYLIRGSLIMFDSFNLDFDIDYTTLGYVAGAAVILICLIILIYNILKSPFSYPYFIHRFDVSGKRKPKIEDLIDRFLNADGYEHIRAHEEEILDWKEKCREKIDKATVLKNLRKSQFLKCVDDDHAYVFIMARKSTRYKQQNYVRTSYKVMQDEAQYAFSFDAMRKRYDGLEEIGHECTLGEYNTKNQRRLMTKNLREEIMKRDNYTCQICGKYMPDEVGLHIDHIIPVSKGGKTVKSNLQVLCSKCNGSKSNKVGD